MKEDREAADRNSPAKEMGNGKTTKFNRFNKRMGENMSNYSKGLGQSITDFFSGQRAADISKW